MAARMNAVLGLLRKAAGLFFDDGSLAIGVLLVLSATAILMNAAWFDGPPAIAFLVGGITAALVENVVRTARLASTRG
jgi:hypothetical protein